MGIMLSDYITSIYWINKQIAGGPCWNTLLHNGVLFPPEYNPIKIPIIYKGEDIILNPEAEEAAIFYTRYIGTEYITNRFNKNFWKDFKKLLDPNIKFDSIDDIDFRNIHKYL